MILVSALSSRGCIAAAVSLSVIEVDFMDPSPELAGLSLKLLTMLMNHIGDDGV